MSTEVAGVVASAIDQCGFSATHERNAHEIYPLKRNHPAVMTDHSLAIENRKLEPGIVGAIAGRPNDRSDLPVGEIQSKRRAFLDLGRRQSMRRLDHAVKTVRLCPLVDPVQEAGH